MDNHEAQTPVDRAGIFRAKPLGWTLQTYDSGAQAIRIQYGIIEQWDGNDWTIKYPPGHCAYGSHFILKKNDGGPNEFAVKQLIESGLWDGDLDRLLGPPPELVVIITTEANTNPKTGENNYPVNWLQINAAVPAEKPSGFQPADPSAIASTKARFGGQFRAIAGSMRPPTGQPAPPPSQQQGHQAPQGGVAPPPGVYPAQGQQAPVAAPSNAPPPPQQQHAAPIDIEDTPF